MNEGQEFQPEAYPEDLAPLEEEEDDFEAAPFQGEDENGSYLDEEEEYEGEEADDFAPPTEIIVPDMVKEFVRFFHKYIQERSSYSINMMYDNFNKVTEKYYQKTAWPPAESVAQYCDNDPLTLILYKELYFRHLYSKFPGITIERRFASWKNYTDLWTYLLNASNDISLVIPNTWLWDMVDEFIYQFESFCHYRAPNKKKTQEELKILRDNPQVWNVINVIFYLQSLINKSNIVQILEKEKNPTKEDSQPIQVHPLFKNLGYFCLVGLLRLHVLLGDYYLALKTVAPIELGKNVYARVISCHIALNYYMGFTYMMIRRYSDAIKIFSNILMYINRAKQYQTRSYQYSDQFSKKSEKLYGLLVICLALCPQRVDENIQNYIKEKYAEKMQKMQKKEESAFEALFNGCCPKFVNPANPNYDDMLAHPEKYPSDPNQKEALRYQTKLFLSEVKQQLALPTIRSYLQLYTTIETKKLADYMEISEEEFRTQLICYKHKTRSLVWNGGPPLAGEWTSSSDIDFYVDNNMVHIDDAKAPRRFSEYYIRNINKFIDIREALN